MLGKLRDTQALAISTRSNDILGKSRIYRRFRPRLGLSDYFFCLRITVVSANRLSYLRGRLFHDIEDLSLLAVHELRMPVEFG